MSSGRRRPATPLSPPPPEPRLLWIIERRQLLDELNSIPVLDMSEDDREDAMRILIADQHARGAAVPNPRHPAAPAQEPSFAPGASWLNAWLNALPEQCRPDTGERLTSAAVDAELAGWDPAAAAEVCARRGWETANNPRGLIVSRLSNLPATMRAIHTDCYEGWIQSSTDRAIPCPICRPESLARLQRIPEPGQRTQQDYQTIRDNRSTQ